jgi:hypothetical protein
MESNRKLNNNDHIFSQSILLKIVKAYEIETIIAVGIASYNLKNAIKEK